RSGSSGSRSGWPTGRSPRSCSAWPWSTTGGSRVPFSCFHSVSHPRPIRVFWQAWPSDSEASMRTFLAIVIVGGAVVAPARAQQDTTDYMTLDPGPKWLFPDAQIARQDVPSTPEFRAKLKTALGRVTPTVWEPEYHTFTAKQNGQVVGYAVIVDEIGKVNPFTLIVSTTPDFRVKDVAVMVYREPRGGEITQKRFLAQYKGKKSSDLMLLNHDIVGITGATLSVQGANRGVHKALAVLEQVYK